MSRRKSECTCECKCREEPEYDCRECKHQCKREREPDCRECGPTCRCKPEKPACRPECKPVCCCTPGPLGPRGPRGVRGEQGEQGEQGEPGTDAINLESAFAELDADFPLINGSDIVVLTAVINSSVNREIFISAAASPRLVRAVASLSEPNMRFRLRVNGSPPSGHLNGAFVTFDTTNVAQSVQGRSASILLRATVPAGAATVQLLVSTQDLEATDTATLAPLAGGAIMYAFQRPT